MAEKDNGTFLLGVVIGGVVGAATAMFLSSEKGKKFIRELGNTNVDELKMSAMELYEIARDKAKELTKQTVREETEKTANDIEEKHQKDTTSNWTSIPIPIDTDAGDKESIEKLLKEAEEALVDAEKKLTRQ